MEKMKTRKKNMSKDIIKEKKKASYLHRTATTTDLCCLPTLED